MTRTDDELAAILRECEARTKKKARERPPGKPAPAKRTARTRKPDA